MSVKGHLKTGGCRVRGSFDVMSKRRGSALFTSKKSLCNAMKRANPVWNFRLDFDTHRVKLISCNAVWSTSHGNEPGCACYYPLEILPPPHQVCWDYRTCYLPGTLSSGSGSFAYACEVPMKNLSGAWSSCGDVSPSDPCLSAATLPDPIESRVLLSRLS